ncbi:MAG TPA: hypothetical protein VEO54_10845 [Thermoanaerobaculia bacterium]|nr:hypothetical protein [Thermoanaerobaculia bacterium]
MTFAQLSLNVIEVKSTAMMFEEVAEPAGTTYETRIKSDGKVEATDTVTK